MQQRPYTLLEFTRHIKNVLNREIGDEYWVIAEIGDLKLHGSGHCYMELLEKREQHITSKIRATIWSSTYQNLAPWFKNETGEELRNGLKILVAVRVNFHEVYGMSLNVTKIDPSFTLGERAKKRKEVLERLTAENLLNRNRELQIALVPSRVAVISSSQAAGFEDFMNQLHGNRYGYHFQVQLFQAVLQGDRAISSISEAMREIQQFSSNFDVIVWIRGGGSQLDLDTFDSYELGSIIARSELPVITGIGHQRDETIADIVAHTRMKTPTAAAEFLIKTILTFEENIVRGYDRIESLARSNINIAQIRTDKLFGRLELLSTRIVERQQSIVGQIENRLKYSFKEQFNKAIHHLNLIESNIDKHNPELIFKKGYTYSTVDGSPVDKIEGPLEGKELVTLGQKKVIYSRISKTQKRNGG